MHMRDEANAPCNGSASIKRTNRQRRIMGRDIITCRSQRPARASPEIVSRGASIPRNLAGIQLERLDSVEVDQWSSSTHHQASQEARLRRPFGYTLNVGFGSFGDHRRPAICYAGHGKLPGLLPDVAIDSILRRVKKALDSAKQLHSVPLQHDRVRPLANLDVLLHRCVDDQLE